MNIYEIPIPPRPKQRPRAVNGKKFPKVFTPPETRAYQAAVGRHVTFVMEDWNDVPTEELAVFLFFAKKDRRASDLDNFIKSLLDGLNGVLWEDDVQIKFIYSDLTVDKNNPHSVIGIMPLKEFNADRAAAISEWETYLKDRKA